MSIPGSDGPQASSHYNAQYFDWQKESGRFGGWANVDKYCGTVGPTDTVLDFGCGGGFLLANLECAKKIGVEPNLSAHEAAKSNGVTLFARSSEVLQALGPGSVDVIISDNALEHALEPLRELKGLLPLLKKGGKLHIVVPCENIGWKYKADDVNRHLYSWSPQSLGNILKCAGFEVHYSRPYVHKWPPFGMARYLSKLGRVPFNVGARLWGQIDRRWFQVEALASRPLNE